MKDCKLYIFFGELLTLGSFLMPYYGMGNYSVKLLDDTSSYFFFFLGILAILFEIANRRILSIISSSIILVEAASLLVTGILTGATVRNYGPALYCIVIGCIFATIGNVCDLPEFKFPFSKNKDAEADTVNDSDNLVEY